MNYLCTNPHCPKKGKGTFYGHHHKSLQYDSDKYLGYFNYHLGKRGYAVDDELYSLIVNSANSQSTASIHKQTQKNIADEHSSADCNYLHASQEDTPQWYPDAMSPHTKHNRFGPSKFS